MMDRTVSKRWPLAALACSCAIYVALFAWLGGHAYPQADDYAFSASLAEHGFWGLQWTMYEGWTGRIFNTFLLSLAVLLPLETYLWLSPLVTIITYIGALYLFMDTVLEEGPFETKASLSLLLTSATLAFLPALCDTLYLLSGAPYFWTTSLLLVALSLAVRAFRGSQGAFWLCLIVLFLNGTMWEPPCVFQGIVAFAAALSFLWRGDRRRAAMAGAFWLASVAAFFVMFLAPGTAVRMGALVQVPFPSRLGRTLAVALAFGAFTVLRFFVKPIVWASLLFLPEIARRVPSFDERLASRLRAWHIILIVALIAPLMQAIAGWASGEGLPLRTESLTVWMMGATWILLWAFAYRGPLAQDRPSRLVAWRWPLLVLCLLVSSNFVDLIEDLRIAPAWLAENRDREERAARQREAGEQDVVVPLLETRPRHLWFSEIRPWPSD